MAEGAVLVELWHIIAVTVPVLSGIVLVYRNGIAPKIKAGKEEVEANASYRTETNGRLKSVESRVEDHINTENKALEAVDIKLNTLLKEGREDRRGLYDSISGLRGEFKHLEGRIDEHLRHD